MLGYLIQIVVFCVTNSNVIDAIKCVLVENGFNQWSTGTKSAIYWPEKGQVLGVESRAERVCLAAEAEALTVSSHKHPVSASDPVSLPHLPTPT